MCVTACVPACVRACVRHILDRLLCACYCTQRCEILTRYSLRREMQCIKIWAPCDLCFARGGCIFAPMLVAALRRLPPQVHVL